MLTMLLNKSVNTKAMKANNKNTEAAILEAADKLFKVEGFKGGYDHDDCRSGRRDPCHVKLLFSHERADQCHPDRFNAEVGRNHHLRQSAPLFR